VLWALFNDVAQRIVTLNKQEQRANVRRIFGQLTRPSGARVLDFGCGTGLFATTLAECHAGYVGYDPDGRLVKYAGALYPSLTFTDDRRRVEDGGPYEAVLANCCFHHISDGDVGDCFDFIGGRLRPGGHFVLIDIIATPEQRASYRHLWGLAERGDHIRTDADYVRLLSGDFEIVHRELTRAYMFSRFSPLYSDMGIYICRPRPAAAGMQGNPQ
jgi:cyclopropane fatty-acyl-phospholipid synthase-like methyltransferase